MNEKLSMEALHRISVEEFKQSDKIPMVIILDNIRSMNNVGSVFRTADAFRATHIYLCGITAQPPHKEIEKTALGATESVSWSHHQSTEEVVKNLLNNNFYVISVEQTHQSISLAEYTPSIEKKTAFIFGNEVMGVSQSVINLSHSSLEIPQLGTKHSLNISVSAGIVMWHYFYHLIKNIKI
jgi:23S rRNA (guanosine2251-2'-O)-methyltransferase